MKGVYKKVTIQKDKKNTVSSLDFISIIQKKKKLY